MTVVWAAGDGATGGADAAAVAAMIAAAKPDAFLWLGDAADTDPLWQLLGPCCTLILGGHAHNMQHFKPDTTGCSQLVSGAGGRSLYAEIPGDPRLEWGEASGYGAVRLELGERLDVQWISETGAVLYHATM